MKLRQGGGRVDQKIILSLCDYSGNWPRYYSEAGYDVRCFDLPHDIRLLHRLDKPVYGILAAPPCTMFAASGNRWKRTDTEMIDALSIVDACLRAVLIYRPKFWALENPVGKLVRYLGKPVMYFDPYEYGDPYTKRTCLWGEFNPPKKRPVVASEGSKMHTDVRDQRDRSLTPLGFSKAFFEANP